MGLPSSSIVTTPTLLAPASFGNLVLVGLGVGPLSNHSFLFPEGSSVVKTPLPFVDLSILKAAAGRLKSAQGEGERTKALKHARQIVADAFGSVAVLNASFRLPLSASVSPDGLCVDLVAVREAYQALLSCESDALISTLGRATLQCTSHLTSVDGGDAENLGCFLIILENPLLLNSLTMCVSLERLINGLASLPKQGTSRIFSWLRHYNSEFFARVVLVVQGFLSYAVTSLQDKVALTCQILASLHEINRTARIVPDALFVSSTVCGRVDLNQERTKYIEATQANSANTRVFNFLQFPFLLSDVVKARFMKQDYDGARALQLHRHKVKYGVYSNPRAPLPPGCIAVASASDSTGVDLVFELAVRRGDHHLLDDVLTQLLGVVLVDADTVKLPMRCRFVGEEGVDQGGLRKELFSLAMKQLVLLTKILKPTSYSGRFLWFNDEAQVEEEEGPLRTTLALLESALATKGTQQTMQVGDRPTQCRGQFALGLLLGIAAYHGCMLDVRMPPCVYKLLLSKDAEGVLALSDLSEVDAALAQSLQALLDFEDGSLSEVFGASFTSSPNPLLDVRGEVELVPGGAGVEVTRANRVKFVSLFVEHTLYRCCQRSIQLYLDGLSKYCSCLTFNTFCQPHDVETLLCGGRELGDLSLLRLGTTYRGGVLHDEHPLVQWFWETVSDLDSAQQRRFLVFVSGSDRVPPGGLGELRLQVQHTLDEASTLPTSHTCFNLIDLPLAYPSLDHLRDKLLLSLDHADGYFGLA